MLRQNDVIPDTPEPSALASAYGGFNTLKPDTGPTGDLMRGPNVLPNRAGPVLPTAGSPPARGAYATIPTSRAQAEARRDTSGFEGVEMENVATANAGAVSGSRVQSETYRPTGTTYAGKTNSNLVGGRVASYASAENGARAQAIAGGRPMVSRYGSTPQTASSRIMAGVPLSTRYPTAVAGSARTQTMAYSGDGGRTGVIASTPLAQSISKAG